MFHFITRRLVQSVFTIFGVMLLTFILFRLIAGDPSALYVSEKAGREAREAWLERHHMNLPAIAPPTGRFWTREFWNTQFFWHLLDSVTFRGRSYAPPNQKLTEIVAERAKYSLAITVPAMVMGWFFGLVIASIVAYFRGRWIDHVVVFISVLGMCIPYLAYMVGVQWAMFQVAPKAAFGLSSAYNVYVPVAIAVVAGLGGTVRFYRTIIVDETNRDYVRTALAKGVPTSGVLFRHVLKNCMLPILTQLVLAIPFLIMGSLLLETFFGVPGLGGLLLSSITARDVPIINGLTFLTAVIYTVGLLLTDVLYAVFDPRIRLR